MFNNKRVGTIASWIIVIWICKVFLSSLPYKFSGDPDTIHIFSTIGAWMTATLSIGLGEFFTQYGAILVGSVELFTSLLLLSPLIIIIISQFIGKSQELFREKAHALGGIIASSVMTGAVFFHLFTPLGIEVLNHGESDGGSLFMTAVSILVLGLVLCVINLKLLRSGRELC